MPTILQINVTANSGSHGKIAEKIGQLAIDKGWRSVIAYGRWANPSKSELIRIGSDFNVKEHGVESRLLDNHGLASRVATKKLINQIEDINPDIVHLHNIHGYYLNFKLLFDYLSLTKKPVVWTLHDCWPFTGHCSHFEFDRCFKWRSECNHCQHKEVYPSSFLLERSRRNYQLKKKCFTSLNNLFLVPVSYWLKDYLQESFLHNQHIAVIHNGVDIGMFRPLIFDRKRNTVEVLGVASNWKMRKGLSDFIQLRKILPESVHITLIGLSKDEIKALPNGISGIERTNSVEELVKYYNQVDVLVNPTYEDNFPSVNLEALACGTPVLTYRTGGSPEAVSKETGWVVEQGDIQRVAEIIMSDLSSVNREDCRKRAEVCFDNGRCFEAYFNLYEKLLCV